MNIPKGFINGLKWTDFVQPYFEPYRNGALRIAGHETVYETRFRGQTYVGFSKQEVENLIAAKYGLLDCRYSVEYEHEDKLQKMGVEV